MTCNLVSAPAGDAVFRFNEFMRRWCVVVTVMLCAMVLAPVAAQAQKLEARMCVNIPQGHNYDTDGGFKVVIMPPGADETANPTDNNSPITLTMVTEEEAAQKMVWGGLTMKVGFTCKVFPIGTGGGTVNDFDLSATTKIVATLWGGNDFCADQLYIQKLKDGKEQQIARFLNSKQKCWGDDFSGAKTELTLLPESFYDSNQLKFLSARGDWAPICRSTDCDSTKTEQSSHTIKVGNSLTNGSSTTVKKEVSAGIEYEGFKAGASMSTSTTNSMSKTIAKDITDGRISSTTVKLGYTPDVRNEFSIVSVWEYVVYAKMSDGAELAVPTAMRGCSSDNNPPRHGPGSADTDRSCQGSLNASKCADENGTCTFPTTDKYVVLYGVPGNVVAKTAITSMECSNVAFGVDPVPGVQKSCSTYSIR